MALLVLTPNAALDPVGVAAGTAGAVSMAFGTVLTRKWQPPCLCSPLPRQLAAGGLLLVPVALVFDPPIPMPTGTNVLGPAWLGLIGAGLTYFLWFRGSRDSNLQLFPYWAFSAGDRRVARMVVLGSDAECASNHRRPARDRGSIWLGQRSNRTPRARIACRKSP